MRADLGELNGAGMGVAAQEYALMADGAVELFPCVDGGREPATAHGFKSSVSLARCPDDRRAVVFDKIGQFWDESGYNIGLVCGGVVDVWDFDHKDGSKPGRRTARTLWDSGVLSGAVGVAETPTGGLHVFTPAAGQRCRSLPGLGLDLKGVGGYVVAAPSTVGWAVVDATGKCASWKTGGYRWVWSRPLADGSPVLWKEVCAVLGVAVKEPRKRTMAEAAEGAEASRETVAYGVWQLARWLEKNGGERNNRLNWAVWNACFVGARTLSEVEPLIEASLGMSGIGERRRVELYRTARSALSKFGSDHGFVVDLETERVITEWER